MNESYSIMSLHIYSRRPSAKGSISYLFEEIKEKSYVLFIVIFLTHISSYYKGVVIQSVIRKP